MATAMLHRAQDEERNGEVEVLYFGLHSLFHLYCWHISVFVGTHGEFQRSKDEETRGREAPGRDRPTTRSSDIPLHLLSQVKLPSDAFAVMWQQVGRKWDFWNAKTNIFSHALCIQTDIVLGFHEATFAHNGGQCKWILGGQRITKTCLLGSSSSVGED